MMNPSDAGVSNANAVRLLVLLVALAVLTALVVDQRPWERLQLAERGLGIVVEGQRFHLDAETAEQARQRSVRHANRGAEGAAEAVAGLVSDELDALFDEFVERIPAYADWYFSLRGEYARLSVLLLQQAGVSGGDYLGDRAIELIFDGEDLQARITAIEERVVALLGGHTEGLRAAWLADLLRLADGLGSVPTERGPATVLVLDELLAEFSGYGRSEFLARISAGSATAAGAGAAAPLLARLAVGSAAATGGRALASKGVGRGAAKAGAAGASALGCAAAGPAAWVCALLVGGGTWVAADWALLSIDEWRNRDALIAEWERRLDELRAEFEAALLAHYHDAVGAWHQGMQREVERSFSPLDAVRGAAAIRR